MTHPDERNANFPTTRWTLVVQAAKELNPFQRDALNELLGQYWPVLKARLVVHRRFSPHDADDFVQGFFMADVLGRNLIQLADKDRGRLRSLLCKSLDRYVSKEMRKRRAKKRLPDRAASYDQDEALQNAARANDASPHDLLEATWARETLAMVLANMELRCTQSNKDQLWHLFEARVVGPILDGMEPVPYDQLVERLGYADSDTAQNALITAKRMFCRTMRETLSAHGVAQPGLDEEIDELKRSLAVY
jgi:hypothetical protein